MRKAINFDLDTNALKEYYCKETGKDYTQAYFDIRKLMKQNGFIHRQGSGYISSDQQSIHQIAYLIVKMQKQLPWTKYCVKVMDVTDIGDKFDFAPEFKKFQQSSEQIVNQYSAGTSSDGAIIIDEENLRRDHPEINLYDDEPSPQDYIKRQEEYTTKLYNEHDSWDQER